MSKDTSHDVSKSTTLPPSYESKETAPGLVSNSASEELKVTSNEGQSDTKTQSTSTGVAFAVNNALSLSSNGMCHQNNSIKDPSLDNQTDERVDSLPVGSPNISAQSNLVANRSADETSAVANSPTLNGPHAVGQKPSTLQDIPLPIPQNVQMQPPNPYFNPIYNSMNTMNNMFHQQGPPMMPNTNMNVNGMNFPNIAPPSNYSDYRPYNAIVRTANQVMPNFPMAYPQQNNFHPNNMFHPPYNMLRSLPQVPPNSYAQMGNNMFLGMNNNNNNMDPSSAQNVNPLKRSHEETNTSTTIFSPSKRPHTVVDVNNTTTVNLSAANTDESNTSPLTATSTSSANNVAPSPSNTNQAPQMVTTTPSNMPFNPYMQNSFFPQQASQLNTLSFPSPMLPQFPNPYYGMMSSFPPMLNSSIPMMTPTSSSTSPSVFSSIPNRGTLTSPASMSSLASPTGNYSRKDKSLTLITAKIVHLYETEYQQHKAALSNSTDNTTTTKSEDDVDDNNNTTNPLRNKTFFSIDMTATKLSVERRRIYDIINILEAIDLVSKKGKNEYWWHGMETLKQTVQSLLTELENEDKIGTDGVVPDSSFDETNSEEFASCASDVGDGDGDKKLPKIKKDKNGFGSLGRLARKFLKLFLSGHDTLSLGEATDLMLAIENKQYTYKQLSSLLSVNSEAPNTAKKGEDQTPSSTKPEENSNENSSETASKTVKTDPDDTIGNQNTPCLVIPNFTKTEEDIKWWKTKIRRLYDIANVLVSLNMIGKLDCTPQNRVTRNTDGRFQKSSNALSALTHSNNQYFYWKFNKDIAEV